MRLDTWPERLTAVLDRYADLPFAWGQADCFDLVADSVEAVTGRAVFAECRGAYDGPTGAARQLIKHGFADLGAFLASLGTEIHPAMAQRGDVGLRVGPEGPSSVVFGGLLWAGRDEHRGLVWIPRSGVLKAWRID